ncbi:MAG TPA: hypothetical protein VGQ86_01645, partial [Candidatus Limnocylindria bacterium]|nr:hypothetical protein [Candidatus Limnocylindria bacterium]
MSLRFVRLFITVVIAASCTPLQSAAPSPDSASPSARPSTAAPLQPGAIRFTVDASRSIATIRVREQVAAIP